MRRSRLDIIRDILLCGRAGATKTQIVYHANLNFKIANESLLRLLKAGYMTLDRPLRGRSRFTTTSKGLSLVEEIQRIESVESDLYTGPELVAAKSPPASRFLVRISNPD